ncbi:MAG TPA: hypothetical protein VHL30_00240, partial [Chlamydiales bacterium]|nr:hypothetical protein [Chlamydiales bacterium]
LSRQPDLRDAMAALDQYHCQSPEQRELWTAWLRCLHQRQLLSYALQCIPHQVGISPVFSAWIISHPSVSLLHLFDYIERMISKLPEYEEIPIQTKDPHYLKTIVSHLSHGLKTQNADLIAWSFLRVGSMGDTAAICQLMNYVDFNQPVFQEPIVQEAISFCAAQMGNRERLKELVEHFGLQTPQTLRAFYCEMNLKAVFQIERTLIRGVHGGKRPFQFYEGSNARFTYRPAFYAWDQPGSASSLAQYSGEEGGFVVWRGSGDTRSYGEGVAEEDLFDVNRLLCFILPSEQHEIVRAISQLSEKEIDQIDRGDVSEETRNLLDRIERNPAIFDLMARGLKTPIDLAPTYLLIAIWRNFQSKTLVLSKRYDRMVDGGRKEIPVFPMPPNYYTQLQKTPYQEFDLFPHSPKHFPGAKTNRMSELVEPTLDHWSILEVLNELSQPSWHLDWEKLTKQVGKMSKWTEYSQALAAIAVSLPPSERERYLSLLKEKTALEPDDVEEVRKEIPADTFFSTSKLLL